MVMTLPAVGLTERPICNVCGSQDKTAMISRPFSDPSVWGFIENYYGGAVDASIGNGIFEIDRCNRCGFLWQRYVLNHSGMQQLYGTWISSTGSLRKRLEGDAAFFAGYAREMMVIAKLHSKSKPHEIRTWDFGMGWGFWCLMSKAFGYESYGTELSEERQHFASGNGIHVTSLNDAPRHYFHFINSEQCFEHLADPRGTLHRLVFSLAPEGVLRISVPDAARSFGTLQRSDWAASKDAFHPLEHVSCFTHSSLIRLAKEEGLEPIARPLVFSGLTLRAALLGLAGSFYYRARGTSLYFRLKRPR
jgi:hypothetical protein